LSLTKELHLGEDTEEEAGLNKDEASYYMLGIILEGVQVHN
jgi:hypothetical protein